MSDKQTSQDHLDRPADSGTPSSTPAGSLSIKPIKPIRDIVVAVLKQEQTFNEVFQEEIEEGSQRCDLELLDPMLDLLGVPDDNTYSEGACDCANATGEWPDWGFCRDSFYDDFYRARDVETFVDDTCRWLAQFQKQGGLPDPPRPNPWAPSTVIDTA